MKRQKKIYHSFLNEGSLRLQKLPLVLYLGLLLLLSSSPQLQLLLLLLFSLLHEDSLPCSLLIFLCPYPI